MKDRYEQEIEQLLNELETDAPEPTPAPADAPPPLDDQPSPFAPRPRQRKVFISPTKLAIAGGILALIGLFLAKLMWLSLAGLVVMAVAVAWMFVRRMGQPSQQYWRGRSIEPEPRGLWPRFRRWLSR
ncbi:MAG: hypothetical protein OXL37_03115 [Chloroflexota bacterium]|nr:hypothetical protein [Chloroflexota bacterium]MDE2961976.1 hypothetical protein [Chloroflexota bacterium]